MWRWQDCLDDNGWLDVASAIVSVNDFFLILLYPILICIVLDAPWSYIVCCFRSFQFEEEEEQEVPSTFVANIHQTQRAIGHTKVCHGVRFINSLWHNQDRQLANPAARYKFRSRPRRFPET